MGDPREYSMGDLQAWRERQQAGEAMILPSGLAVTLQRVSLLALATQGRIPQTLVAPVQQVMESKASSLAVKDYPQFGKVLDLVVKACVVEPTLVDFGDAVCLGLDELPIEDKLAIFSWANAPAEGLRPFRGEQGELPIVARLGTGVCHTAIDTAGD